MPIEGLAPRYRELGRLKFGEDLGDRPTQLRTWRLTSSQAALIDAAAALWGGEPVYGQTPEVVTETDALEVLIPPQDVAQNQWWELWTAGGLQRRCTGTALVEHDDAEPTGWRKVAPCVCDEENGPRACKPTTVLRVLLPQLPDLGVWRLTTRSIWAATELPPAANVLLELSGGNPAPAILGLDERSTKKPGQGARAFVVPVLRTRSTLGELIQSDQARGLQPLPLELEQADGVPSLPAAGADPQAPQAPSGPRSAQTAASASEWPQDAAAAAFGTSGTGDREKRALERPQRPPDLLADFLDDHPPASLPHTTAELVEVLEDLERLMVAARLWKADDRSPLDHAAERWLEGADWRAGDLMTAKLRTFAQRAVMAAVQDLTKERSHL